ncbi:MAG: hypothetical protein H6926_02975 [Chromatiales bacterium]|nr:hypothetical protein [Gammaproteobacteria bacterium]MCP5352137.1 hypothetical protein [Chromatiales bacterium]
MRTFPGKTVTVLLAACALLASHGVAARADFSADTTMTSAQGQTMSGRMVVSKGRVRLEYEVKGQTVVQINDPANQKIWMLFPARKQFTVRDAPPGALTSGLGASARENPCEELTGAECTDLGDDEIHGRAARKWMVRMSRMGQTMTMTQWTDKARGFPLRQDFGGGAGAELVLIGEEEIDGRPVEKWRLTMQRGDASRVDEQWFDPELGTTIREHKHDGSTRALTRIRVGDQDETLFQIPSGYHQLDADAGAY